LKVLPTLNIQNGRVMPLLEPAPSSERTTEELVEFLLDRGCCRFDLTDRDAAQNRGNNRALIAALMRKIRGSNSKVCIQVGGGIRSSDQAQFFLDHGATWLVVGAVLQGYPVVVDQLLARFRDQLVASVDARRGEVQSSGGLGPAGMSATSIAGRIRDLGFKRILFIDISLDPGGDPDFPTAQAICELARIPLFMGGSIRSPLHMTQAAAVRGLQGVLVDAHTVLGFPEMINSSAQSCS
jgi:phosphoribosylformimino-5-aminoimidazole carboxamide ribotide isomerase